MSAEKQSEKQIPSLNEYSLQPWTEWVNKTAKVSTILVDKEANCNKYSNVRLLPRKDVSLYGLFPKMDQRVLNECDQCRAIILPEAFVIHSHNCASEITLIKKKHGAKSKKKKDRYMTMRVPAPPLFQFPPSYDSKSATENDLQQRKEEENEQLVSGIEQIDLITDSNKSEFGCEGSDGGHRNDSGETGPGPWPATCGAGVERQIQARNDTIISESADTATHQTGTAAGAGARDGGSASITPPPPPQSSPPTTTPPPPAPSTCPATSNITSSCTSSTPVTAITVTIPVIPATAQHSSITSTGSIIVAAAPSASASAVSIGDNNVVNSSSSSGPSYRRHKKSGRSSRSATLATMAASTATPTTTTTVTTSTSATSTHLVATSSGSSSTEQTSVASHALAHPTKLTSTATVVIVSSAATAIGTNSAPTVAASSLLTISCDIIISIKPRPKAAQQQSVRSVRSGPVAAKVAVPLPPIAAPGPVPVHIPIPIPAVLPPRHLPHGARGQVSRSVVNSLRPGASLLSPRTVACVRPRITVEREQERYRSLLKRANEHRCFNTAIPSPTHHQHKLKQLHKQHLHLNPHHHSIRSASRGFLPCYSTTPSYIAPAHPVALISPLQISMYKTQEHTNTTGSQWMNQQAGIGQLRNTNASIIYNGHPKPLTLMTASTRRISDTFLLQGQRVDSQLHDIQTYLSKRFTNTTNAKVQLSDTQLLDQSSPLHHHSNLHNHHHRPNILKNSNSASSGGTRIHSTSSGIGSKRSASAKEDATSSSSASSSSSPAAKVRHIGNTTSVAEVNGIILHADLSSESASEAPSFTLPVGLVIAGDSVDSGIPLSPTETMNAIQAITVAPDTCDFSELHIFEVSQ